MTNISLEALEGAFAEIEQVGKGELTFDVRGIPVTLRVLLPQEENEVQGYSTSVLPSGEDEEVDELSALEYLDRFKVGVLSYAICQIGDTDFRDVQYIPTGEKLNNGKEIKEQKHLAIRRLVEKWTRSMVQAVFRKYGELLTRVEEDAEKAIYFEPVDLGSEITRLEERVSDLKKMQKARAEQDKKEAGVFSGKVQQIANSGKGNNVVAQDNTVSQMPEQQGPEDVEEQQPVSTERQSPRPKQTAPPTSPQPSQQPPSEKPSQPSQPSQDSQDSFVDPDNLESAVAAEEARLLQRRMAQGRDIGVPDPGPDNALSSPAKPPAVRHGRPGLSPEEESALEAQTQSGLSQVGSLGDIPIYRPDQVEVVAAAPKKSSAKPSINPSPQGRKNPRFRGSGK